MDTQKLQLKLFATEASARAVDPEAFIAIFHRWIREGVLPELVIDVANYAHVAEGPGVVLIGHGSDYFVDQGEGRLGLLHSRKRLGAPPAERMLDLARRTLHAALLLERDPAFSGKLRFATNELLFRINDRLVARNDAPTFAALRPELEELGKRIFEGPFELLQVGGAKELFAVRFRVTESLSLPALLERSGGPPGRDATRSSPAG